MNPLLFSCPPSPAPPTVLRVPSGGGREGKREAGGGGEGTRERISCGGGKYSEREGEERNRQLAAN